MLEDVNRLQVAYSKWLIIVSSSNYLIIGSSSKYLAKLAKFQPAPVNAFHVHFLQRSRGF